MAEQTEIISQRSEEAGSIKAVEVDIYDSQAKEIMRFGGGICISEEKAQRGEKSNRERTNGKAK